MPDSAMKVRRNVKPLMEFLKHTAFWEGRAEAVPART